MKKSQLRKLIVNQRQDISTTEAEVLSNQLLTQFKTLDLSDITTLHIFIPIAEKKEPNTFVIIDWLQQNHPDIKIILPKADFDNASMTHHPYEGRERLTKNLFHILEPSSSELHLGSIDLVVIPMLAFDRKGYRVGYGKGFYDRFLQDSDALKVGLCFYPPVASIEDVNAYDVKMDLCITPTKIFRF